MTYIIRKFTQDEDGQAHHTDINNILSIKWSDRLNDIYLMFSFTTYEKLETGDYVALYNTVTEQYAWIGLITMILNSHDKVGYQYSGYDIGFLMEKNTITIQYQDADIDNAIKSICNHWEYQIKNLPKDAKKYRTTKIYYNQTISYVFKELLNVYKEKSGYKHCYIDCFNGSFNIFNYCYREDLSSILANTFEIKSSDTIHNYNILTSINEIKNKVVAVDGAGKILNKKAHENKEIIKQCGGILQYAYKLDCGKNNDYDVLTNNKLKELSQAKHTIDVTMLGDYRMRKGIVIPLDVTSIDNRAKPSDNYLITGSEHIIVGTKETVKVSLELFTDDIKNIKTLDERFI